MVGKIILLIVLGAAAWWLWTNRKHSNSTLDRNEAAQLLGVSVTANRETILAAHRRLIERVHPDTGGSQVLAAKVNRARDTLLSSLGDRSSD